MDPTRLTARQIAAGVAARQISAVEVIEAHLGRIETVNPRVNAVVTVLAESARAEAAALDARLAAGETPGRSAAFPSR